MNHSTSEINNFFILEVVRNDYIRKIIIITISIVKFMFKLKLKN